MSLSILSRSITRAVLANKGGIRVSYNNRGLLHLESSACIGRLGGSFKLYSTNKDGPLSGEEEGKSPKPKPNITSESLLSQEMVDSMANESAKRSEKDADASPSSQKTDGGAETRSDTEGTAHPQWAETAKRADYQARSDARRTRRLVISFAAFGGFVAAMGGYMSREWSEEEWHAHREVANGYTPELMWKRFKIRWDEMWSFYTGPSIPVELPPEDGTKRPTLIIGVEDALIHSEWTRQDGWKTYKRPGLDYFLTYLSQYYEIVLFSSEYANFAERTVIKLDPYHLFLSMAFFRESSYYIDGKIVKDIEDINRDLKKVVMVDVDPAAYSRQPDNAVPLKKWDGNPNDTELINLIPLLEWIAASGIEDVRTFLKTFEGAEDYALEYAKREAALRSRALEKQGVPSQNKLIATIGKMFGIAVPETKAIIPQDYIREQGIKRYEAMQAYINEHKEEIIAENKQREQELTQQSFTLATALGGMSGAPPQQSSAASTN
ncbi:NLI interacting factor-like phosphatase-domain-containing protein [Dipodascopsis uninucleata]